MPYYVWVDGLRLLQKAAVFQRTFAGILFKPAGKVIAVGKTAPDGDFGNRKVGAAKQLYRCPDPQRGDIFNRAGPVDRMKNAAEMAYGHAGHCCQLIDVKFFPIVVFHIGNCCGDGYRIIGMRYLLLP